MLNMSYINLTKTGFTETWEVIAMNVDGQYRIAGTRSYNPNGSNNFINRLWQSNDGGNTWIENTTENIKDVRWGGGAIVISNNGKDCVAIESKGLYAFIWLSNDYGKHWTENTQAGQKRWEGLAMSGDGQYLAAADFYGYIWLSNDRGKHWTENTQAGQKGWRGLAMSDDGQHLAALANNGRIWQSNDGGKHWSEKNTGDKIWMDIAMSADGQYRAAVENSGRIWQSNDHGNTWSESMYVGPYILFHIVMSRDGQYRMVNTDRKKYIWQSHDYGVNWKEYTEAGEKNWRDIAMTGDGRYRTAVVEDGNIWNWEFFSLCNYYKRMQAQPTTNVVGEVCCPEGASLTLQETTTENNVNEHNKFLQKIISKTRPGITNRLCGL